MINNNNNNNNDKDNSNLTEKKCVFVFAEDGKHGISKHFKSLDPIFDGAGWWLKEEHMAQVKQLCQQANMNCIELDLPIEDWGTFKRRNFLEFYRSKQSEVNTIIEQLKLKLNINFEINDILNDQIKIEELNKEFIAPLNEYKKLEKRIKRIENEELIASITNTSSINIQFIDTLSTNYLLEESPEMPKLVNINERGKHKPFIRKGIVAELVGAGGVGKTHFLTQLAISIASGINFLKIFPIEKTGHVFLVLGENSNEDIHRLLRKTYKGLISSNQDERIKDAGTRLAVMSVTGRDASFIQKDGSPTMFFKELLDALKKQEPEEGWSCLIFDPISRFLGADAENDNAAATRFISLLEQLTLELKGNPTVLFAHHMNKSSLNGEDTDQTAGRGSSALTDGVRLQINLERLKDDTTKIKMKVVKSNHTGIPPAQILVKDEFGCLNFYEEVEPKVKASKDFTPAIETKISNPLVEETNERYLQAVAFGKNKGKYG